MPQRHQKKRRGFRPKEETTTTKSPAGETFASEHAQAFASVAQSTARLMGDLDYAPAHAADLPPPPSQPSDDADVEELSRVVSLLSVAGAAESSGDGSNEDNEVEHVYETDADGVQHCIAVMKRSRERMASVALGFPPSHPLMCADGESTISYIYSQHLALEGADDDLA